MKLTPEEVLALGNINPELDEILQTNPYVVVFDAETNIPELREQLLKVKKDMTALLESENDPSYVEEDIRIPVRDGSTIAIQIHKPKALPDDGCPIFVVYHGGGFCLGGLDNEVVLCRAFTALGGIAVNVDYRLAPEHPFPVPCLDAYDALKWTAAHFKELGGNPQKGFLVGGISAGANFASILSYLARDDKLSPPLTGSYLSIPACGPKELFPEKYMDVYLSREQNRNAPILDDVAMKLFNNLYKPDPKSPLRSPLAFESHKNLPPTYFQVCGMDPLRDDALIYERILSEDNGVKTKVDLYPGLPHGFWSVWVDAEFTKGFRRDSINAMKWLLEQSKG